MLKLPRILGQELGVAQHAAGETAACKFANLPPLVEHVLEDDVRLQLHRFRFVHLPPQLSVALAPGHEQRLGEGCGAVGPGHARIHLMT